MGLATCDQLIVYFCIDFNDSLHPKTQESSSDIRGFKKICLDIPGFGDAMFGGGLCRSEALVRRLDEIVLRFASFCCCCRHEPSGLGKRLGREFKASYASTSTFVCGLSTHDERQQAFWRPCSYAVMRATTIWSPGTVVISNWVTRYYVDEKGAVVRTPAHLHIGAWRDADDEVCRRLQRDATLTFCRRSAEASQFRLCWDVTMSFLLKSPRLFSRDITTSPVLHITGTDLGSPCFYSHLKSCTLRVSGLQKSHNHNLLHFLPGGPLVFTDGTLYSVSSSLTCTMALLNRQTVLVGIVALVLLPVVTYYLTSALFHRRILSKSRNKVPPTVPYQVPGVFHAFSLATVGPQKYLAQLMCVSALPCQYDCTDKE
jgi:hypothetical protein